MDLTQDLGGKKGSNIEKKSTKWMEKNPTKVSDRPTEKYRETERKHRGKGQAAVGFWRVASPERSFI